MLMTKYWVSRRESQKKVNSWEFQKNKSLLDFKIWMSTLPFPKISKKLKNWVKELMERWCKLFIFHQDENTLVNGLNMCFMMTKEREDFCEKC
jgi:hypothetical protein